MTNEEITKVLKECFGEDTELLEEEEINYLKFSVESGRKIVEIIRVFVSEDVLAYKNFSNDADSMICVRCRILKNENGEELSKEDKEKNDWVCEAGWDNKIQKFEETPLDIRLQVLTSKFVERGILTWKKNSVLIFY